MKRLKKMVLLLLVMFLGYGKDLFGWKYTIANMTDQPVKVQLLDIFGTSINVEKKNVVQPYETRTMDLRWFAGGSCVNKIKVSTQKTGKWQEGEKVKIKFVTAKEYEKLGEIEVVGDILEQAVRWWGRAMCDDKDFILIEEPPGSGKIVAITTTTN